MSSLEELDVMRQETIVGLRMFYRSLEGNQNPIQVVRRIQGKVTELITYIQALEEYINRLPCTPKDRSEPKSALECPLRNDELHDVLQGT